MREREIETEKEKKEKDRVKYRSNMIDETRITTSYVDEAKKLVYLYNVVVTRVQCQKGGRYS